MILVNHSGITTWSVNTKLQTILLVLGAAKMPLEVQSSCMALQRQMYVQNQKRYPVKLSMYLHCSCDLWTYALWTANILLVLHHRYIELV